MRYIISFLLASVSAPALADVPVVITDLPAVHAITSQVMGDLGEPVLLLDKGASAHSFQLRPSQAGALADADLIVWIGPEMTPWLDRALEGLSQDTPRLGLLAAPGTYLRTFGAEEDHAEDDHGDAEDHEHAHEPKTETAEHADEHGDDQSHDDHSHTGVDPHAWLDPANAMLWTTLIADELGRLDPANAATYAANAATAKDGLAKLDAELSTLLAPTKGKPFVVFHDAYGYFAAHYGLTVAGTVALGDATSPSAARLAELHETVTSLNVVCLFPEAQHDAALVLRLAEATGARVGGELDPSGSTLDPGPDSYAQLLRNLGNTLNACLNQ